MLWWKAVHIIAVISWMAGLLYLFRLFVYHNEETEAIVKERLVMMERRLFNIIATPALFIALISGLAMITYQPIYYMKAGWFHAKLFLLLFLIGLHFWSVLIRRKLLHAPQPYSKGKLRFLNEVPTLLMILIVILAVVRPF